MLEKGEELFTTEEIALEPPGMARLFESVICDDCKEPTMATRIVKRGERKLCIPCNEKDEKGGF